MKELATELSEGKKKIIKWSVYWGIVFILYIAASIIMDNFEMYAFVLIVAAFIFAVEAAVAYPLKKLTKKKIRYAVFAVVNAFIFAAVGVSGYFVAVNGSNGNMRIIDSYDYGVFKHTSEYDYDGDTGVYTVRSENDAFKILQLTDVHICAGVNTHTTDRRAFDACYNLIKDTQPDLIIVTGDIAYTMIIQTLSLNNLKPMRQFCTFMNKVGIPWAMVYGNHDTDEALYGPADMENMFAQFRAEGAPMLYAAKKPDVSGRYNQYIRVENAAGSLNRVLFLIDSNSYTGGGGALSLKYDNVHEDQIAWYSDTVDKLSKDNDGTVRSFVYMHIPFRAFDEAQIALQNGSPEAKYLFGTNDEKVCFPETESGFFDKILEKHSTDAVFVGHDHVNTMGINYKGVDLVYGKSIDFSAYMRIQNRKHQRGATLVTLDTLGGYVINQIDYNG